MGDEEDGYDCGYPTLPPTRGKRKTREHSRRPSQIQFRVFHRLQYLRPICKRFSFGRQHSFPSVSVLFELKEASRTGTLSATSSQTCLIPNPFFFLSPVVSDNPNGFSFHSKFVSSAFLMSYSTILSCHVKNSNDLNAWLNSSPRNVSKASNHACLSKSSYQSQKIDETFAEGESLNTA